MVFVVGFQKFVEHFPLSVKGEAQVSYASFLPLFEKKIQHTVVNVSVLEVFHTFSDAVQEVVVQVVGPEVLEGLAVHQQRVFP